MTRPETTWPTPPGLTPICLKRPAVAAFIDALRKGLPQKKSS
jgi:hypothetical protein